MLTESAPMKQTTTQAIMQFSCRFTRKIPLKAASILIPHQEPYQTTDLFCLHFNMINLIHYSRVAYYQLLKPRIWRLLLQERTRNAQSLSQSAPKSLFFNAEDHSKISILLKDSLPAETIAQQADEALHHRFAFFTETPREHGERINWHKDYASGRVWDADKPSHTLDFLTSHNGSDVKYAWELSRCHWFTWLGMAHLQDPPNKRYAQAFQEDVRSWINDNPVGMGINWAMPMEVAIRSTNWILAHSFFHNEEIIQRDFWQEFTHSLWQHGKFLSYNLEYVRHNANHFISNAMGLVILGAFFRHKRQGRRWLAMGKRFLEKEILLQFTKDGVHFEKSTSYHRFVTEMLTLASIAAERADSSFSHQYHQRLTAALGYMASYMRPDGSAPMIGDTDNGRVLRCLAHEDFNNHLSTLLLGAAHCKNSNLTSAFASIPSSYNIEKHILLHSAQQSHHTNPSTSIPSTTKPSSFTSETYFIQSGYIIHKTEDTHLFIDVGDYGMNGWGGHGHNDCLSFEFWLQGHTIFTDSGTGCYTSNIALRNQLRSTKAHNTVMVGRREQVEWLESSLWRIKHDDLDPSVLEQRSGKQGTAHTFYLLAEHSAYKQRFGVQHRRGLRLNSTGENGELAVTDELIPFEQAMIGIGGVAYYHLLPEITPTRIASGHIILGHSEHPSLHLEFTANSHIEIERCLISRFYGDVREGWRLGVECSLDTRAEARFRWRISTANG